MSASGSASSRRGRELPNGQEKRLPTAPSALRGPLALVPDYDYDQQRRGRRRIASLTQLRSDLARKRSSTCHPADASSSPPRPARTRTPQPQLKASSEALGDGVVLQSTKGLVARIDTSQLKSQQAAGRGAGGGRGRGRKPPADSADRWRTMDRILAGGSGGSAELTAMRAASDYLVKRTVKDEARAQCSVLDAFDFSLRLVSFERYDLRESAAGRLRAESVGQTISL